MIAGIILAAGASSRMGRPKALLDFHGETFIDRLIRLMRKSCDEVVVVLGYHAGEILAKAKGDVKFAVNPDPERGQLSSLQAALHKLYPPDEAHKPGGFLFIPVDCPAVKPSTVEKVATAAAQRTLDILFVIPRNGDRRGHPVFAAAVMAHEFLALPPTAQARDVVHKYVKQTRYIEVDDTGILSDIDDQQDYQRLIKGQP